LSWNEVKLSDFLSVRNERFNPNDKVISGLKRIDKIDFSGNIYLSDKTSNTDMILVKKGDLVISGINVAKGAMAVYQGDNDVLATIHYSSYKFDKNKIDIDFLKLFLNSSEFINALKEQVQGGIKTEIKPKHLLPLIVKIPTTLVEQKNIVKKLNSQLFQINNLCFEQSRQLDMITKLRNQILNDAIQGRLTAEWRKQHSNTESATLLLNRIKTEKEQLIKDKKIKIEKQLLPIVRTDIPFELPIGWVWCRLGDLLTFGPINGFSPNKTKRENGVKCLTLTATTSGIFKENYFKIVDAKIPSESYLWLVKNDILLQRGNSIDYVGIAALYEGEPHKFIFPDLMIKIQVSKHLSSKYIQKVLISPFNRKYFSSNASGTQKSMPKINHRVILNTLIPLPPLSEQKAIVYKLETLLVKCDQLQAEIENMNRYSKELLKALFNEAFEGGN
jgi:type I restriction enzyme S subunit